MAGPSIMLLQERFRELEKAKKRREIFMKRNQVSNIDRPIVSLKPIDDSLTRSDAQDRCRLSLGIKPNHAKKKSPRSSLTKDLGRENHVDTSLHL